MTTTDDLMGGEWEQEARRLHVESDGWIRGHYVPTALHSVRNVARIADTLGNRAGLQQLSDALGKLDLEIEKYQHRMATLREQVGLMRSLVLRARDKAPDKSGKELERDRLDGLDRSVDQVMRFYGRPGDGA